MTLVEAFVLSVGSNFLMFYVCSKMMSNQKMKIIKARQTMVEHALNLKTHQNDTDHKEVMWIAGYAAATEDFWKLINKKEY